MSLIPIHVPAIPDLPIQRINYGQVGNRNVAIESPFTNTVQIISRDICQHEGSIIFAPMLDYDVGRLKAWIDSLHGSSDVFSLKLPDESFTGTRVKTPTFDYASRQSYRFARHPDNDVIVVYRTNERHQPTNLLLDVNDFFDRPVLFDATVNGNLTNYAVNRDVSRNTQVVATLIDNLATAIAIVPMHERIDFEAPGVVYNQGLYTMSNLINVRLKTDGYSIAKVPGGYYTQVALQWIEVIA